MTVRAVVKETIERTLVWSGGAALARQRMNGRVLVLAYHNIVPDDAPTDGDVANHLPLSSFAAQIAELRTTHDVVPLSEALAEPVRPGRPRAAITFDDAYRGAVIHGIGELNKHGLPATIFVAPAFLGGRSFWWDALANRANGGLDPGLREHALRLLRGEDAPIREYATAKGLPISAVPDFACAASEVELLRAAGSPGITLGSHTWGHPNLTCLTPDELRTELTTPLAWLRERVPDALPWIAYPYGFFNDAVERAAAAAGYAAGLAISGGWLTRPPADIFALPRLNIPRGLSLRGFSLRAAGFLSK